MRVRNIKGNLPEVDLDLIERLLKFANLERIESQQQVYDLFMPNLYVVKAPLPNGTVKFAKWLPEIDGVQPFLNDQEEVKKALEDIASRKAAAIDELLNKISTKLHEKLTAFLRVTLKRGQLRLTGEPALDAMEAILWYAMALIFHHGIDGLVRVCKTELKPGPCGRVFLYTPKLRRYCSPAHAREGKPLAVRRAIDAWQADTPEKVVKLLSRAAAKDERLLGKRERMWLEVFGQDRFREMRGCLIALDTETPIRRFVKALPQDVRERLQQAMEAAQNRGKRKPKTVTKKPKRRRRHGKKK